MLLLFYRMFNIILTMSDISIYTAGCWQLENKKGHYVVHIIKYFNGNKGNLRFSLYDAEANDRG